MTLIAQMVKSVTEVFTPKRTVVTDKRCTKCGTFKVKYSNGRLRCLCCARAYSRAARQTPGHKAWRKRWSKVYRQTSPVYKAYLKRRKQPSQEYKRARRKTDIWKSTRNKWLAKRRVDCMPDPAVSHKVWSVREDGLVMDTSLTIRQVAMRTGRTYEAVNGRANRLGADRSFRSFAAK